MYKMFRADEGVCGVKDVMIDFETLGNGKNAAVCQVGACFFNRDTGEIISTFKRNIDARSAVKSGAELDADTVYWWLSQCREAIDSISEGPLHEITATFAELNNYLEPAEAIWSHATFDFVILSETIKRLGLKPKYSYRAARDIRTLLDLSGVDYKDFQREGVHHDGLSDAIHQVKYCTYALNKLKEKK